MQVKAKDFVKELKALDNPDGNKRPTIRISKEGYERGLALINKGKDTAIKLMDARLFEAAEAEINALAIHAETFLSLLVQEDEKP